MTFLTTWKLSGIIQIIPALIAKTTEILKFELILKIPEKRLLFKENEEECAEKTKQPKKILKIIRHVPNSL